MGASFLRQQGTHRWHRAQYVVYELERTGECPDVFGFGGCLTQLIEVKISRSDFHADKKKYWRRNPEYGLGQLRSYLCPEGIIKEEDLPPYWGLLYVNDKGKIYVVKYPDSQASNHVAEMNLAASILRREGIGARIFSYKKCKEDEND